MNEKYEFAIIPIKELREIIREELQAIMPLKPNMNPEERLTRLEAAKFLNISYQSMYNWTKEGIIKEHGAGKKKFYLKTELIEALKNEAD